MRARGPSRLVGCSLSCSKEGKGETKLGRHSVSGWGEEGEQRPKFEFSFARASNSLGISPARSRRASISAGAAPAPACLPASLPPRRPFVSPVCSSKRGSPLASREHDVLTRQLHFKRILPRPFIACRNLWLG